MATALRGASLLGDPTLNKGTAFTGAERRRLGLEGLLPDQVETIADQLLRTRASYEEFNTDLGRHIFLRALQDANEVLFYRFLVENLAELLPVIYTPTVGQACQQFSRIYRRPHGLFLSHQGRDRLTERLSGASDGVEVIVVTDGERILGLGDQGVGGMGIAIGKLSLYAAAGGIDPRRTLPVCLDVGTNNPELLDDPLYLGARHERVSGPDYEEFVASFVDAVRRRFPGVLLQWEDFAQHHATALLDRHRRRILSFNDDIQGTAAIALAAVSGALRVTGVEPSAARVVIAGAGSAGTGIASMLVASGVDPGGVFLHDSKGLLHDRRTQIAPHQLPHAQPWPRVQAWADPDGPTTLSTTVASVAPQVLIGVSGRAGLFDEALVTDMARRCARPVVLPLSNPTTSSEAHPADILRWTRGRALVATGSPFDDVSHDGRRHVIAQANNLHVFPGLGMGCLVAGASWVSDSMLGAAAGAVADAARASGDHSRILPPLSDVVATSREVALAVAAAARAEAQGGADSGEPDEIARRVDSRWWWPEYPEIVALDR